MQPPSFNVALVIPTGVGAAIGGYGGDAAREMTLLASVCDTLITHPNVANAALFNRLPENALYVEGYALDQFFLDAWALRPTRANRIGVIIDQAVEPEMLTLHLNAINALKTLYGFSISGVHLTSSPLRLNGQFDPSGASSGSLENPRILLEAADEALEQGAEALALCARMPELTGEDAYRQGNGVDPVGGVEALLSHLVGSEFRVPCAHAPIFSKEASMPLLSEVVAPRSAVEYITSTFLPCILMGLARAPRPIPVADARPGDLRVDAIQAVVAPANALGGIPMLAALKRGIPVIAVAENSTVLTVDAAALGELGARALLARSYAEAAGWLQAMRLGMAVPFGDRGVSVFPVRSDLK